MQVSSLFGGYNLTPLSKITEIDNNATLHQKEALLISGFVRPCFFGGKSLIFST